MKKELNKNGDQLVCKEDIYVSPIDRSDTIEMIEDYHYLKLLPRTAPICLGVFKKGTENPIGTLIFGPLGGRSTLSGMFTKGDMFTPNGGVFIPSNHSVLELKRMFVFDGHGFNIESVSISKSFEWFRATRPEVRVLVAYSDPTFNHRGTIYQATNWLCQTVYSGSSRLSDYRICLKPASERTQSDWLHSRNQVHLYGTRDIEVLKRKISSTFWKQNEGKKYRYVYFLWKKEREILKKNLSHPILEKYPKEVFDPNPIEEIQVTE
jgi:hypothetical protein